MKSYEAKPGLVEAAKLKRHIISDDSSNVSSSDDSLLGANHNTNFETASLSNEDDDVSSGGEDGIVLHLHDISYMREAVKQPDYEANYEEYYKDDSFIFEPIPITPRPPVIRFQVPIARGRHNDNFRRQHSYESSDSQTSYSQVLRHDSQVNLLVNNSASGSNCSLHERAAAAEEANYNDKSLPGPSNR